MQDKKPADSGQGSLQGLFTEAVLAGASEDGCGEALGLLFRFLKSLKR